jgi:two-component system sensor histidine kinase/response regulator
MLDLLGRYFLTGDDGGVGLVPGLYDTPLVVLSVLVAVLTSYMALQLAVKARQSPNARLRRAALTAGALTLGTGVWSMHFIGMLAFQLCTQVQYDRVITALSVLPALGAAWVALTQLSARQVGGWRLLVGGVLMGAGIGLMHYSGMAAMQMSAALRYDPVGFGASIVVAVVLAVLALWVRAGLAWRAWVPQRAADLLAAIVMGAAISGMHYTAMRASRFVGTATQEAAASRPLDLALAIAVLTVGVSALSAVVSAALRYRIVYLELRRSENRLQALFDTAVDGVLRMDVAGRILGVNRAAAQIFGGTEEALIGLDLGRLVPALGGSIPDGVTETVGQTLDGRQLPLRLAIGRSEGDGETLRVAFIADVSERRRIEQALADNEQRLRSLVANLPGAVISGLHDPASGRTRLVFATEAIEALTGWRPGDFADNGPAQGALVHPDDQGDATRPPRRTLPASGAYQTEYRIVRRDGEVRWLAETGTVTPQDGQLQPRVDAFVMDVTEARLRNAEFAGVLTAIRRALVVIEFDLEGHITHANENFLALTGYGADELLGRHHRMLCLPGEAQAADYAEHWAALRRGEFRSGEYERVGKDGQRIWIQATYNPILDASGKPMRIVKFITDLTERHALMTDLRDAKDRAEQAAAAKSSFLANMSHEIRTPMNAIIGFTDVVLDGELPPASRQHMQTVQRSARALLGLLNDILDTAKLENGAVELESRPFALRQLCEDVLSTLELGARRKGLELRLQVDDRLPAVLEGDPLRLRQVLLNLAGNAVKFTEQGSVTVSARCIEGDQIEIEVVDTGIGIPADRLERIFDPFSQADATMTRRFGGTGLGTTIARQLVQLMGGRIGVQSTPGEGSRFWVHLPLVAAEGVPSGFGSLAGRSWGSLPPMHLLIADDVPENLALLELRLRQQGHTVQTAANGLEALTAMRMGGVDLALLDVQMPVMDGLQACRVLREHEAALGLPRLPVIALTASAMQGDRDMTLAAGMDGFAVKPIDWPALHAEMARVLGLEAPAPAVTAVTPAAAAGLPPGHDWSAALARWGSADLLRQQLQRFLDDCLAHWPHGREDPAWAHRLRGTLANFGVQAGAEQLAALERGDTADVSAAWREEHARLQALRAALAAPAASTIAPPAAWNPADARALDLALSRGELPDELSQRVLQALPAAAREPLDGALMDFDFEAARRHLARLMEDLG